MSNHFKANVVFTDKRKRADCLGDSNKSYSLPREKGVYIIEQSAPTMESTRSSIEGFDGHEDYITGKDIFIDSLKNNVRFFLFPALLVKSVFRSCITIMNSAREYLAFHLTKGTFYDLKHSHQKDVYPPRG